MISSVHAFTASVLHYLMTFFFDSRHFLWRGHCEVFARTCRSGSQALFKRRLVEEGQNHSRLAGSILHTYPTPVRDEHGGSGSGVVLTTRQSNAHCAFVDEDDFIFAEVFMCRNFVPRWHFLRTDDQWNARLMPQQMGYSSP
jgi:hypothetical protein